MSPIHHLLNPAAQSKVLPWPLLIIADYIIWKQPLMCSYAFISGNIFSVEKIKPVGYLCTSLPTARCQAKPGPKSSHLTKLLFTICNSIPYCHKVKKDTFQCSNVLLIYLNVERLKFQVGNRSKFQKIKRSSSQIEW